ncbi:MAG: dephospho-CoA kinase [bacterium]
MVVVGLTGGVASGKSTVSNLFRELGVRVVDADVIAREVVKPRRRAWREIVKHFGKEILQEDGTIDRRKLGRIVFSDKRKLQILNDIVHPEVYRRMWKAVEVARRNRERLVILDVPLLFESPSPYKFDKIIVVYSDEKSQLDRLTQRSKLSREEALSRIRAQMPLDEKLARADYVVDNCGTLEETAQQVRRIWQALIREASA